MDAFVQGRWLYIHPASKVCEDTCWKCGSPEGVGRKPMKAKQTRRVGYNRLQSITASVTVPLCKRCDFVRRNAGLLMVASIALFFVVLPMVAISQMDALGVGPVVITTLVGPVLAFVLPILIFRRSCFELGDLDENGYIGLGWVHRSVLADVEASAFE